MEKHTDGLAQAFYLAQLQACKGDCECEACKLLRQATDEMTKLVLAKVPIPRPERRK